jgi:hypothetical protein
MNDRITYAIASLVFVACLGAAGFTTLSITRQRRDLQLAASIEGTEGMPPHVALATAALGTFRGLAVDVLWARADSLQDKGQFFEAQTLSQWITALQPRFPKVWGFQAWNMAYNISASTTVAAERWGWITRAIDLLRRQGIPLNPKDANLNMELGWIYFHKVGGRNDREHWYYKARLARDFREVLGDMTGGRTSAQAVERFRRVVDAPDNLAQAAANDADVRAALDLLERNGAKPDEDFLRMLGRALMYTKSTDAQIRVGRVLPRGTNREIVAECLENPPIGKAVFDVIVPILQKKVIVDHYKMDPGLMLDLMQKYGPLDWAHPHAHGIYWSERGTRLGRETLRRDQLNELTIIRTRLGNLQQLLRSGRVEFDALSDRIDILPDPRFIEGYEVGIQEAMKLIESEQGLSAAGFGLATAQDLLKGYETFLQQATVFSYLYGDEAEARGCYGKLQQLAADTGKADQPMYAEGLDGFMAIKMSEVLEVDVGNTRQFIDAMIQRAIVDGLSKGRLDTFNRFVKIAYRIYDRRYGASVAGSKHVNKEAQLPPFPQLVEASFENYMKQASNPVLVRARIWAWAPEELKTEVWDQLTETFADHCKATGLDVARAFPKPAGVPAATSTGADATNGESQSRGAAAAQARDPA